jgi:thymidylate synthase
MYIVFKSMSYYEHIQLSLEETVQAIEEGKKKKYFHEKNKSYWEEQEKKKVKSSRLNSRST